MMRTMEIVDERRDSTIKVMYEAYRDGDIKLQKAVARVGMSEDDFLKAAETILASNAAQNKNSF